MVVYHAALVAYLVIVAGNPGVPRDNPYPTRPSGQYSKKVPADEDWTNLKKSSSSGIYVIIMALSLWARAIIATNADEQTLFWTIVDDIHWVLNQILEKDRKVSQKRSQTDSGSKPDKRCVLFMKLQMSM